MRQGLILGACGSPSPRGLPGGRRQEGRRGLRQGLQRQGPRRAEDRAGDGDGDLQGQGRRHQGERQAERLLLHRQELQELRPALRLALARQGRQQRPAGPHPGRRTRSGRSASRCRASTATTATSSPSAGPRASSPTTRRPARRPSSHGEWNTTEVISMDGKLTGKVNGVQVGEGQAEEIKEGPLGWQSEGAPIEFRNIRIKEMK